MAAAAAGAAVTINGYRPLAKRGYPSVAAFLLGVLATEVSIPLAAVQAVGLAMLPGPASRPARRILQLTTGASLVGLVGLDRAGHRAGIPLKAALDDGLGVDRIRDADGLWGPRPGGPGPVKPPGLIRMARIYRNYAHDADISYGDHGAANLLDIWRRPDVDKAGHAPVLLHIPGGAWSTGSKRGQAHPQLSHLTELGWVCVSINYRLSPKNSWPDHIVDVKRAIAWVKANIANYGGDPEFVAVTGGSAGGHLSALAALTANDPALQPGFEDADTTVQAAVPFYGVYDFTRTDGALHQMMVPFLEKLVVKQPRSTAPEIFAAASPITHVRADAPAFFVLHGRNDSFIPVEQARSFTRRLREVSTQPVLYAELPLAQHAFDTFSSPRSRHAAAAVVEFLAEIYSRRESSLERRHP